MPHFPQDRLLALHKAAVEAGLLEQREALLGGLPLDFVGTLPAEESPSEQLLCDLQQLNRAVPLPDGTVPLQQWLQVAAYLARPLNRHSPFEEALAALTSQPAPAGRERWTVTLSATVDKLDPAVIARLTAALSELAGDPRLVIERLAPGSVVVHVLTTREGGQRLAHLFEQGQLAEVLGFRVLAVARAPTIAGGAFSGSWQWVALSGAAIALVGTLAVLWLWFSPEPPVPEPVPEPVPVPEPLSLGGTLTLWPQAGGELILKREDDAITTVKASGAFAFPPQPLDGDGDGHIDPSWSVELAVDSCPPLPLALDRAHPTAQSWVVPFAQHMILKRACYLSITDLPDATVGTLLALTPLSGETRYAVVDEVQPERIGATPLGPWPDCTGACWPRKVECTEVANVFIERARQDQGWKPSLAHLLDIGGCPTEVQRLLRKEAITPVMPP